MKTRSVSSKTAPRGSSLAVIAAGGLLLAGCVVTSVYPWYTAKDVVFEPALVGQWQGTEPGAKTDIKADEFWEFEKMTDKAYRLTVAEKNGRKEFNAHLFKLGRRSFLDCLPRERPEDGLPLHYLLLVNKTTPTFEFTMLNYDWLTKLLEANPEALRHVIVPKKLDESGDGDLVLTANTAELQRFLLKHVNDTNAFGEPAVMKRR